MVCSYLSFFFTLILIVIQCYRRSDRNSSRSHPTCQRINRRSQDGRINQEDIDSENYLIRQPSTLVTSTYQELSFTAPGDPTNMSKAQLQQYGIEVIPADQIVSQTNKLHIYGAIARQLVNAGKPCIFLTKYQSYRLRKI